MIGGGAHAADAARPPRHVLMTADPIGGVWTYALELAAGLGRRGTGVTLAVMGARPSRAQARRAARVPGLDLRESGFRLEWMDDPWDDVDAAGAWLLAIADEIRCDLVHVNGFAHAALPFGVPVLMVAHSCVVTWWQAVHGCDPPGRLDEYRRRVRRAVRAADAVVAPTAAMLGAFERAHGRARRAQVIHNGRDAAASDLVVKEPFVLCAGRLGDEAKNLAALERAARGLPWPVLVAGDLPDRRRAAAPTVQAVGRLEDEALAGLMARAAIYAHPARYEPFGLAPLEAGLAGAALVLGDIASLREVWSDAARYVDPDDTSALHDALLELCRDPTGRARLAARARDRARELGAATMVEGYRLAYAELMATPEAAGSSARPGAAATRQQPGGRA